MPAGFPCPNPTCTHVFSPEALKTGTVKCPRCGGVFNFRGSAPVSRPTPPRPAPAPAAKAPARPAPPPAPVKAPPPKPAAPPVAIPMAAVPVPTAIPVAAVPGGAPPSSNLDFATDPGLTISTPRTPQRKAPRPWRTVIVALLSLAGTAALLFGIYTIIAQNAGPGSTDISSDLKEFNCSLKPPAGWKRDRDLEGDMHVVYAMRRKNPDMHVALDVADFEERFPNKSLLIDNFKEHVGTLFDDLAWQPKRPASIDRLDKLGTLAKQPAYVLEFQGKRFDEYYEGECAIMEYRGFVYWFFTFALQTDLKNKKVLEKAWGELRDDLVLLNQREGWNPQERRTKPHRGKGYEVSYPIDVWIKPGGKPSDPACDLELFGEDKRTKPGEDEESRSGKAGHFHVVLLGKADEKDPDKLLRDHFLKQQVAAGLGKLDDMKLEVVKDRQGKPLESEREFGTAKGHVVKHKLTVTGMPARFVVLASIPQDEQTIGVYAEGAFNLRDFWEQEINAVLEGLVINK